MLEEGFFDPHKPLQIRRGELPHWRQDGALYFVTFRLSDSLPNARLDEWRKERESWRNARSDLTYEELMIRSLDQRRRIERWLDRGQGSGILASETAKTIVAEALRYFDGVRYELGDFAVAVNHVHALLRTALGIDLSDVLYSWKRFTSRRLYETPAARDAFSTSRHLWQTESFDHIVRNIQGLEKIRRYIRKHDLLASR